MAGIAAGRREVLRGIKCGIKIRNGFDNLELLCKDKSVINNMQQF
jgi:hypothetical protein